MSSSGEVSPLSITPAGTPLSNNQAPKYGTLIPNRIFVGGIAANTNEQELKQFFSAYGAVKDCKIIADRAGVSKGYGFITFETQEDADKIIKKDADNLIFKDRKLNIGPAIRKQQAFPRPYEPSMSPGAVFFTNGVPYTYQNGMAVFQTSDGYMPVQQPQAAAAYPMMMPSAQPAVYALSQQGYTYTSPTAAAAATAGNWSTAAATAAAQWRWPQSPPQAAGAGQYMYPMQTMPAAAAAQELLYPQTPGYTAAELTEASMVDAAAAAAAAAQVEGSMVMEGSLVQPPQFVEVPLASPLSPESPPQPAQQQQPQPPPPSAAPAADHHHHQPSTSSRSTAVSYGKRPAAPLVATPRQHVGYPPSSLAYSPRATPPPAKLFQGVACSAASDVPPTTSPLTPPPTPEVL